MVALQPGSLGRLTFALALCLAGMTSSSLFAQPLIRIAAPAAAAGPAAEVKAADERAADSEKKFPGGAPMKTDPELEQLLTRAEQFAADGRYDLAAVLWQKVLDETGDTLFTRDGRVYFGLSAEVERILKETADEALRVYRVTADGEAQGVLAAGAAQATTPDSKDGLEAALARVVSRYFLSSYGDDAAFQLGCLALDRHDFVGAYRLFTKVLEQHPDPSMPRAGVLLRLAVASSRIGDHAAAASALAAAESESDGVSAGLIAEVKKEIARVKTMSVADTNSNGEFRMTLGGPERRGVMPALPDKLTKSSLREMWSIAFPVNGAQATAEARRGGREPFRDPTPETAAVAANAESLVQRWRDNQWSPAGQLLFADGKVFIKTNNDLACWDVSSPFEKPVWRSTWLNDFKVDPQTQMLVNLGVAQMNTKQPIQPSEVQFFGDRVQQSMSIAGGMIFNLEGERRARHSRTREMAGQPQPQHAGFQYGVTPRRSRKNWLAAYELSTGRARWRRGADDTAKNDDTEVGFMAAPVPYGNLLLVPVTDGGAMWLYGLSVEDGVTAWKTYLCDEPTGGCAPWSPISVSVAGSDAYVLCGAGVVFSIDAVSGAIRYAVRYTRDGDPNQQLQGMGYGVGQLQLKGFEDDAAIPFGRALLVMASDHDGLFALDRRTGDVLWRTPRTPFDLTAKYCLGLADGGLFVAGTNVVRKYDAAGGKLLWERSTGAEMFGRGALTSDAIYVPIKGQVGGAVLKLDLKTGEVLAKAGVSVGEQTGDAPLGSLFSDGEKLWVLSGHRVSMLADDDYERRSLDRRIDGGDGAAHVERARLLLSQGEFEAAVADLEAAYRRQAARREEHLVAAAVTSVLVDLRLFQSHPEAALLVLTRLIGWERQAGRPIEDSLVEPLRGAVEMLSYVDAPEALPLLIEAARELPPESWPLVSRAVLRSAKESHAELLGQAAAGSANALAVSAEALAQVAPQAAADQLSPHLGHENPWIRLAVARGLSRLGKRESVGTLSGLLGADDARIRMEADFVLRKITGQDFAFDPFADAGKRAAAEELWKNWLAGAGAAAELLPLPSAPAEAGFTLVCTGLQNVAVVFDRAGNELKRMPVEGAWTCQALPNGHSLFSCQTALLLVELDSAGNEVWRTNGIRGIAASVERLPNGTTLIACPDAQSVAEILYKGGYASEHSTPGRPFDAHRLPGGATLLASVIGDDGRVSEITPSGKELWAASGLPGLLRARRLPSGNLLAVQSSQNAVRELDAKGKTLWQRDGLSTPTDACRLSSGNTLIVDANRLMEVDSQGVILWERAVPGAVGVSRF